MQNKNIQLDVNFLSQLHGYLTTKPYREVGQFIPYLEAQIEQQMADKPEPEVRLEHVQEEAAKEPSVK